MIPDFPFKSVGLTVQARDREEEDDYPNTVSFSRVETSNACPVNGDELIPSAGADMGRANCQGALHVPEQFQVWI